MQALIGVQASRVWDDPRHRDAWASEIAGQLGWSVQLDDARVEALRGLDTPFTLIGRTRDLTGLDYVDVFYSHRADPDTPLEETMGALDSAVRQGKALYVGVSSYSARRTAEAVRILRELGTPLLIHQPSYSLLNRWIEESLLDTLEREGVGCIAFTALAQGLLTDKYLQGVPADSRMAGPDATLSRDLLTEQNLKHIRALNEIAQRRGQSLAQMALAWCLRDERITSVVVGASSVQQLQNSLGALDRADFTVDELAEIDGHAVEGGVDLWRSSSSS